jgi:hypothetical protein
MEIYNNFYDDIWEFIEFLNVNKNKLNNILVSDIMKRMNDGHDDEDIYEKFLTFSISLSIYIDFYRNNKDILVITSYSIYHFKNSYLIAIKLFQEEKYQEGIEQIKMASKFLYDVNEDDVYFEDNDLIS